MPSRNPFIIMLDQKIGVGEITLQQKRQVLAARSRFNRLRGSIVAQHRGEVVAVSGRDVFSGATIHDAVDKAYSAHPDKMPYFEEVE